MIEIYEINGQRAINSAQKFKTEALAADRVFIMEENGEIGIGVLGLTGGTVIIKDIITDKPFEYFDLLARSLLSILRDMPRIKVRVKYNEYFFRFGFKEIKENGRQQGQINQSNIQANNQSSNNQSDGQEYLEIFSDDINLAGYCKGANK